MMNEASASTAKSAHRSTRLDKVVQADGEIPLNAQRSTLQIALLTGGGDKPYALGMAAALTSVGIHVDFIGSDDLSVPELLSNDRVKFLNLRGDQSEQ